MAEDTGPNLPAGSVLEAVPPGAPTVEGGLRLEDVADFSFSRASFVGRPEPAVAVPLSTRVIGGLLEGVAEQAQLALNRAVARVATPGRFDVGSEPPYFAAFPVISAADSSHYNAVTNPRGWAPEFVKDPLGYIRSFEDAILSRRRVCIMNAAGRDRAGHRTHEYTADGKAADKLTSPLGLESGIHVKFAEALDWLLDNEVEVFLYVGGETMKAYPRGAWKYLQDLQRFLMASGLPDDPDRIRIILDDMGDCLDTEETTTHFRYAAMQHGGYQVGFEPWMRDSHTRKTLQRRICRPDFFAALSQRASAGWDQCNDPNNSDPLLSPAVLTGLFGVGCVVLVLGNKSTDPKYPTLDTPALRCAAAKDHIDRCAATWARWSEAREAAINENLAPEGALLVGVSMVGLTSDGFFAEFGR